MKHLLTLCLLSCLSLCAAAQDIASMHTLWTLDDEHHGESPMEVVFGAESFNFFDNREVHSPYQRSQTLFGSRLGVELGLRSDANTIMVGVTGVKDFGQSGLAHEDFTFYYHYAEGRVTGAFGSLPRTLLRRELPDIFVSDSIRYYSPTLHGVLLQYATENGYAEVYCNWLGKQGEREREVFEIVTDGRFGSKGYYAGWCAQLLHFSVPRHAMGEQVYDKIMLNPHVGFERSGLRWADAISIEGGLMLSLNRDRRYMVWQAPMGFLGEARVRKGRVELHERLYAGNPQLTDYETFGNALHRGDPYYRSDLYSRTDIRLYLLSRPTVQCYAGASFHLTEGALDTSQQVILRATF